ncbi:MAG: hypothetical protein HQ490_05020 [Lutibacter sp.]|nr:hypothetical protein [Lutibacter sp.]
MNNSEIAILILAGNPEKYQDFIQAVKIGWCQDALNSGFKVFFYSGGHDCDCVLNSYEIRVEEDDAIENCYNKFIAAKNVLLSNFPDIKLVFRTNVSSYIDVEVFVKYLRKANFTENSYHGIRGAAYKYSELFYANKFLHSFFKYMCIGPKIYFFSGASMFIGSNLLNSLSYKKQKKYMIDDVEIGFQINNYVKHDIKFERIYVTKNYKKMKLDLYVNLVEESLLFNYKFKSSNRYIDCNCLSNFSDPLFRREFLTF